MGLGKISGHPALTGEEWGFAKYEFRGEEVDERKDMKHVNMCHIM